MSNSSTPRLNYFRPRPKTSQKKTPTTDVPKFELIDNQNIFKFDKHSKFSDSKHSRSQPPGQESATTKLENYLGVFGETADDENLHYISDLLATKAKVKKTQEAEAKKHMRTKSELPKTNDTQPTRQEPSPKVQEELKLSFRKSVSNSAMNYDSLAESDLTEVPASPNNAMFLQKSDSKTFIPKEKALSSPKGTSSKAQGHREEAKALQLQEKEPKQEGGIEKNNLERRKSLSANGERLGLDSPEEEYSSPQRSKDSNRASDKMNENVQNSGFDTSKDKNQEFYSVLDNYISYFEQSTQFTSKIPSNYFIESHNQPRRNSNQQAIEDNRLSEMIQLKQYIQKLEHELERVNNSRKSIHDELAQYRQENVALHSRISELNQENLMLAKCYKNSKVKLSYTKELLAKEKIDNEQNLVALKRVISNNSNVGNMGYPSQYLQQTQEPNFPQPRVRTQSYQFRNTMQDQFYPQQSYLNQPTFEKNNRFGFLDNRQSMNSNFSSNNRPTVKTEKKPESKKRVEVAKSKSHKILIISDDEEDTGTNQTLNTSEFDLSYDIDKLTKNLTSDKYNRFIGNRGTPIKGLDEKHKYSNQRFEPSYTHQKELKTTPLKPKYEDFNERKVDYMLRTRAGSNPNFGRFDKFSNDIFKRADLLDESSTTNDFSYSIQNSD